MPLRSLVRKIEKLEQLDAASAKLSKLVADTVGHGDLKAFLSGSWLGHQLHPMLTDLPIGLWSGAVTLDMVGGRGSQRAANRLTALGVLSVPLTAAAGSSDWADSYGPEARIGLAHAAGNVLATTLFAGSLVSQRHRRALRLLGMAALLGSGYLGGHLVYARGVGVSHVAFDEPPTKWTVVSLDGEGPLLEAKPRRGKAKGYGLFVYLLDGVTYVLADRCTHAGGPLHEGEVDGALCVRCPWHLSAFRIADGGVVAGPASQPQPCFDVREEGGKLEVRLRE